MNVAELIKKAEELMDQGQTDLALRIYFQVIDYYRKNRKKMEINDDILIAYNNAVALGMHLAESKNDLVKMRDLAREFLRVVKRSNNSEMYAIACFHAGVAHNALGECKEAIPLLEEAIVVFELLGHDEGIMLASRNLAEAYRGLGLESKAEVYQDRADALAKKLGERGLLRSVSATLKKWLELPWVIKK